MKPVMATTEHLGIIATCHILAFPHTLSAKLGHVFVMDSLRPFVTQANKFMLLIEIDGQCAGYVNANVRDGSLGSASSMLQSAFGAGIKAFLVRPWLLFHPEMMAKARLVVRNIRYKVLGHPEKKTAYKKDDGSLVVGLPGMCVHPNYRGRGFATKLMMAAEAEARKRGYTRLRCTVAANNPAAWKGHQKIGFTIVEEVKGQYKMEKDLE